METISTIKKVNGELCAYDQNDDLIATIKKTSGRTEEYQIFWYGGLLHGKMSYALDWQDLNDKVSIVAKENNKKAA